MEAEEELRRRAEVVLRSARGEVSRLEGDGRQFELDLHRIELELQNAELLRLEAELHSSRDHYLHAFEHAPVALLALDEKGTILEVNATAAALLGGERWRLVGRRFSAFVAVRDAETWTQHLGELATSGTCADCTLELHDREGRDRGMRVFSRSSETGTLSALVPEAAERRHWLDAESLRHVDVAVIGADTHGRIELVNRAAEQLLGYSRAELEGQPLAVLTRGLDLGSPGWHAAVGKDGGAVVVESTVETWSDGGERHVTITLQRRAAAAGAGRP